MQACTNGTAMRFAPNISFGMKLALWAFALVVGGGFALVLFGGGGWLLYLGGGQVIEGLQSRGWPSAPAQVVHAGVVQKTSGRTRNANGKVYAVELRYTFELAGQRHAGTRRSLDDEGKLLGQEHAEEIVRSFPVGSRVTAHYDPDSPARSLLTPGVPVTGVLLILFGLGLWICGLLPLWWMRPRRRAARR